MCGLLLTGNFIQLPVDDLVSQGRFVSPGDAQGCKYNASGTGGATGVDFWVHGVAIYNYVVAMNGSSLVANGQGWAAGPSVTDTSSGAANSATILGTPFAGLNFSRAVSFQDTDQVIRIVDTLTNTGATPLTQIATLDSTDPDQDFPAFADFKTLNDVVTGVVANDLVTASGPTSDLTLGFGSPSPLRVVDASGFGNIDPYPIIVAPMDPNGASEDIAINLAVNYGTLAAGQAKTTTWFIAFGATKSTAIANYQAAAAPPATPTSTPTRTFTHTPTRTFTHTPTRTFTHTPTRTFTHTPTRTFTHTPTATISTPTPSVTLTSTPTNTPPTVPPGTGVRIRSGNVSPGGTITLPVEITGGVTNLGVANVEVYYSTTVATATGCAADPGNVFDSKNL